MEFAQIISFAAAKHDQVQDLFERWTADATEEGEAGQGFLARDRNNPDRYVLVARFPSAEAAQKNSDRPETDAYAKELAGLCTDGPSFTDLDVVWSD